MANENDRLRELRQLLNEGREILNDPFVRLGHHEEFKQQFIRWENAVADWLDRVFPDRGYSGQWVALEGSNLQLHLVNKDVDGIMGVVRARLGWLSILAQQELKTSASVSSAVGSNKVFVVHGRDEALRACFENGIFYFNV